MRANGGSMVPGGFYWHRNSWELVPVSGTRGVLPGSEADAYTKIPLLAVLLIAPIMGGLYVVFLPFIGFAMLGMAVLRKLRGGKAVTTPVAPERPEAAPQKRVVVSITASGDDNRDRGAGSGDH